MKFIRFEGNRKNEKSNSFVGIFQLAFELRDGDELEKHFKDELIKNINWLKMHLKSPLELRFDENFRAISWFHPRAVEPLKRIRIIKSILEEHRYVINDVKTSDPGIIIYEDGWQVVAKPKKSQNK